MTWAADMRPFLGKRVRVVLDREDENAVAVGKLLAFDEGGEAVILDEEGFKHWCWPMLEVIAE